MNDEIAVARATTSSLDKAARHALLDTDSTRLTPVMTAINASTTTLGCTWPPPSQLISSGATANMSALTATDATVAASMLCLTRRSSPWPTARGTHPCSTVLNGVDATMT